MIEGNQKFGNHAGRVWLRTRFSIRVRLILLALIAALPLVVDRIRDADSSATSVSGPPTSRSSNWPSAAQAIRPT